MAKEGLPFLIFFLLPAALFLLIGFWIAALVCALLAAFMVFFFRDPERDSPSEDTVVVSPADGRVVMVTPAVPGSMDSPSTQVSIFLSPLDVHINRAPISGEVTEVVYKRGAYHIASRAIASVENQQNVVTLRGKCATIVFRQIAGVLARRLVLRVKPGDRVRLGQRIGLMKFGSRMDVLVPAGVDVLVRPGQRVTGGVTVIGRIRCDGAESPAAGSQPRTPGIEEGAHDG
jgi:phosphatidylserine decarboxylase